MAATSSLSWKDRDHRDDRLPRHRSFGFRRESGGIDFLDATGRIAVPAGAARTVPVILACAKATFAATVTRQLARMALQQRAHRGQFLVPRVECEPRLSQAFETEQ